MNICLDLGTVVGGDGPYYEGNLIVEDMYEDGKYFAIEYIDCGDGPVEEPYIITDKYSSYEELEKELIEKGYL